ncbi:hypothetical protein [Histidinibacterium aquaticum]|uniref:Sulfotransferase n=1 Tax=Histidinibacterium aquaticum TaxID=2613962 RepID=A0A5J5GQR5_9RHOB|nr:hypothetical protein [Histidinibacterium aquaticum]KAA9010397.1 hypothetical protein F3S47_03900 [Histidinibacterium aquaticum]
MTKQLVFIASGGRTGTQFFGDMLGEVISDCHSEHEPDMVAGASRLTLDRLRRFGAWHMGPGRLMGRRGVRVVGQRLLEGRIDPETAISRLRSSRRAYHDGLNSSLIVESYYAWWMVADRIGQIWPGAKLAGVIRDPRDWITSWQRHEPKRRRGALTERLPPGPLTPEKLGDREAAVLWPQLDQVGRLAWEWALICRTLDRASGGNSNVEVFRFEDLFGPDPGALNNLARFVAEHAEGPPHQIGDFDAIAGSRRNASSGPPLRWQAWSDAQVAAVAHFCGDAMRAHGYGGEPDWRARVAASGSL